MNEIGQHVTSTHTTIDGTTPPDATRSGSPHSPIEKIQQSDIAFAEAPISADELPPLPSGFLLDNDHYRIKRELGHGGFGITYLATDNRLKKDVVIKENAPRACCRRENQSTITATEGAEATYEHIRRAFYQEAEILAKDELLKAKHLISVHNILECNGTVYCVMDFVKGESLKDIVPPHDEWNETDMLPALTALLHTLHTLHRYGIYHLDIKPANILLRDNRMECPVLIDFGAACHFHDASAFVSGAYTPGYAPPEQIVTDFGAPIGPHSDVYALGATLYKLLTGTLPPTAEERMQQESYCPLSSYPELRLRFSQVFLAAADRALALRPEHRFTSAEAWLNELEQLTFQDDSLPYRAPLRHGHYSIMRRLSANEYLALSNRHQEMRILRFPHATHTPEQLASIRERAAESMSGSHPHVISVADIFEEDDTLHIVYPYADPSFIDAAWVAENYPMEATDILTGLMQQYLEALAYLEDKCSHALAIKEQIGMPIIQGQAYLCDEDYVCGYLSDTAPNSCCILARNLWSRGQTEINESIYQESLRSSFTKALKSRYFSALQWLFDLRRSPEIPQPPSSDEEDLPLPPPLPQGHVLPNGDSRYVIQSCLFRNHLGSLYRVTTQFGPHFSTETDGCLLEIFPAALCDRDSTTQRVTPRPGREAEFQDWLISICGTWKQAKYLFHKQGTLFAPVSYHGAGLLFKRRDFRLLPLWFADHENDAAAPLRVLRSYLRLLSRTDFTYDSFSPNHQFVMQDGNIIPFHPYPHAHRSAQEQAACLKRLGHLMRHLLLPSDAAADTPLHLHPELRKKYADALLHSIDRATSDTQAWQSADEWQAVLPQLPRCIGESIYGGTIKAILEQSAMCATYQVQEKITAATICVRELLNRRTAGLRHDPLYQETEALFLREADILRQLRVPNVAPVESPRKEGSSVFYTILWIPGYDLETLWSMHPEPWTESRLRPLLLSLLNGLDALHQHGLLHMAVRPAAIMLKPDETPVLIDFNMAATATRTLNYVGYTPPEAQDKERPLGPWTDLYALGAILHRLITGTIPPDSTEREKEDTYRPLADRTELRGTYTTALLRSVDKALSLRAEERWQCADEWRKALTEDEQPFRRLASLRTVSPIADAVFSPDGTLFAFACVNGDIHIGSVETGRLIAAQAINEPVQSLGFSPIGNTLAVAVGRRGICLLNTETWEIQRRLFPESEVSALAFSEDGSRLAIGCVHAADNEFRAELYDYEEILRLPEGQELSACLMAVPHRTRVRNVCPAPQAHLFASAASDGCCLVADTNTQGYLYISSVSPDNTGKEQQAFSPRGHHFATINAEGSLSVTALQKGCITEHQARRTPPTAVCYSADGSYLLNGDSNGTLTCRHLKTRRETEIALAKTEITLLRVTPDGRRLSVLTDDGHFYLYACRWACL